MYARVEVLQIVDAYKRGARAGGDHAFFRLEKLADSRTFLHTRLHRGIICLFFGGRLL